jgi:HIP---CoA ligase
VAQAAVIGIRHERLGQVGKAFVVPTGAVSAEELLSWARERMAGFKVPRYVQFVDELPLNATGKVRKDQLR